MKNEWSKMATLLHICMHLKDDACECGSYATLEEVLEALRSKYGLTIREARTRLTSLNRPRQRSKEVVRSSLCRPAADAQAENDTRLVLQFLEPGLLTVTFASYETAESLRSREG